jgi:hypothetical protein
MSEFRKSYINFRGEEYSVTWNPITHEVYVASGKWYAGKAYSMQEALDVALGYLNGHVR